MEEEKNNSFYEFLQANSKLKLNQSEKKTFSKKVLLFSWLLLFFANVTVLWVSWNFFACVVFHLPHINYIQSLLLYSGIKVLARGFFVPG